MKQQLVKSIGILVLALALCSISSVAHATLILVLNTTDKTFALTGSDSGTAKEISPAIGDVVGWDLSGAFGITTNSTQLHNTGLAYSVTNGSAGNGFNRDILLQARAPGGNPEIALELHYTVPNVQQTITGSGVFQSYNNLSAIAISAFESSIGSALTLTSGTGSGFSPVNIVAIPEPSSGLLLTGGLLGIAASGRRRKA